MTYEKLEPVKVFVNGYNSNYDVQLKINGASVGKLKIKKIEF